MKLKFWDKFNKRWINAESLKLSTLGEIIGVRDSAENFFGPNQFETVRSTGRKDMDGTEIFEGNIIKCNGGAEDFLFEVGFINGCFVAKVDWVNPEDMDYPTLRYYIGWKFIPFYKIIGSIQENPELIKEK